MLHFLLWPLTGFFWGQCLVLLTAVYLKGQPRALLAASVPGILASKEQEISFPQEVYQGPGWLSELL